MNDDRLIEELARVAREEQAAERGRLAGRGEALVGGRLSPEEEAELRALAAGSEREAVAFEALRPLGESFKERVVGAIEDELEKGPPASRVVSLAEARRRRAARWWLPAAALAAASVALLLWPGGTPEPLPAYRLELAGEVQTLRSAAAGGEGERERRLLAPGNRLRLVLRPSVAVEGPLAFEAFVARGGETRPLRWPEVSISEQGAVFARGTLVEAAGGEARAGDGDTLELPAGDTTLLLAVGREGELPSAAELRRRLSSRPSYEGPAWVAWAVPVRLEVAPQE